LPITQSEIVLLVCQAKIDNDILALD